MDDEKRPEEAMLSAERGDGKTASTCAGESVQDADAPWLAGDCSAWNREVAAWLEQSGRACRLGRIVRLIGVKARLWSMVMRVEFEHGTAWFKACGRGGRHEPGLLEYLKRRWPGHAPEVSVADHDRSWMLLADAGMPMRDIAGPKAQVAVLKRLLPLYGAMQMASASDAAALIDMGLPDRRPARLPGLLEDLLAGGALRAAQGDRQGLREAALRLMPALRQCCRVLAEAPHAAALDHGDLHTGNFLVRGENYRLADWGDACVGYPFCSLGVLLEAALAAAPDADRPRTAAQLIAAYLEPWGCVSTPATLRDEMEAALWMAHVVRALDFAHMCREKEGSVAPGWQSFIADALATWVGEPVPALAK